MKDKAGKPAMTSGSEVPAAAPPESLERWSAKQKTELVLRLLRGEALDAVSRESQAPARELRSWTRVFVKQGTRGLRIRREPEKREVILARAKIDELVMRLESLGERKSSRRASGMSIREIRNVGDRLRNACRELLSWVQCELPSQRLEPTRHNATLITGDLASTFGARLLKLHEAVCVLANYQCPMEAGILVLSMLETTTDILYIERSRSKALKYYRHEDVTLAPVAMSDKLNDLDGGRKALYRPLHTFLSMIKHNNPVAGVHLYSWAPTRRGRYRRRPRTSSSSSEVLDRLRKAMEKLGSLRTLSEVRAPVWVVYLGTLLLADAFDAIVHLYGDLLEENYGDHLEMWGEGNEKNEDSTDDRPLNWWEEIQRWEAVLWKPLGDRSPRWRSP